ncbi:kinase-like domain-containing protein [Pelagophyceae sp. CCMP2097]|nr:kinase-like domain-containing protein [Pelagophyceae sp. CCMP2097]
MGEVSLAKHKKDGAYVALKCVSKGYVAKHDDERHVHNERTILHKLKHPFVVSLFGTFQDAKRIYFVLEFVAGGELFSKVRGNKCLTEASARFYLCEILAALAHVHAAGYVYRDLKPENVLLDCEGHCRLVDFGFACAPPGGDADAGLLRTNCGTPAYLSPEQLARKKTGGYTRIVDWWAFGCVTFELMTGRTPFCKDHAEDSHHAIYLRVIKGKISFPGFVSNTARAAVKQLLCAEVSRRLVGAAKIKQHAFFDGVDWPAVEQKRIRPPSTPLSLPPGDASCFDEFRPRDVADDCVDASRCNFSGF